MLIGSPPHNAGWVSSCQVSLNIPALGETNVKCTFLLSLGRMTPKMRNHPVYHKSVSLKSYQEREYFNHILKSLLQTNSLIVNRWSEWLIVDWLKMKKHYTISNVKEESLQRSSVLDSKWIFHRNFLSKKAGMNSGRYRYSDGMTPKRRRMEWRQKNEASKTAKIPSKRNKLRLFHRSWC